VQHGHITLLEGTMSTAFKAATLPHKPISPLTPVPVPHAFDRSILRNLQKLVQDEHV